jgi:transcriptional regulator with XRE-family HTH domain
MTKPNQITNFKGFYSEIARKCGVSPAYVSLINKGLREVKTKKAKKVAEALKNANELFRV